MLLKRFLAILIDTIAIQVVVWIIFTLILGMDAIGYLGGFLATLAYQVFFLPKDGQTPGKKILGVRVVKLDGSPVTIQTAVLRTIGYYLNTILLFTGWLLAIFTGRGYHDYLAGTKVVE